MELIIDIPEEDYNMILLSDKTAMAEFVAKEAMMYAIKDGIPLPQNHGDLIDRNELIENGINKGFCDWYDEIKNVDAIIEAERGK